MKKRLLFLFFMMVGDYFLGEPIFLNNIGIVDFGYRGHSPFTCSIFKDDNVFMIYRKEPVDVLDAFGVFEYNLSSSEKKYDRFGFPYYEVPNLQLCVLFGGNRFVYIDNSYEYANDSGKDFAWLYAWENDFPSSSYITNVYDPAIIDEMLNKCKPSFKYINNGVSLTCDSNLKDSRHSYNIENISQNFITDYLGKDMVWDSCVIPWAEAENGSGIGVEIKVDFNPNEYGLQDEYEIGMCKSFVIMNGYVDFFRRDLYKKNNRVKKFRVQSNDGLDTFDFIVDLEDTPEFQEIKLPRYTKSVKLTIVDVYNGTLYDDTCLTAIMTKGKNSATSDFTVDDVNTYLNSEWIIRLPWSERKRLVIDNSPVGEMHH